MDKREEVLKKIGLDVLNLKNSVLAKERVQNNYLPVIGEGNYFADIMFVGEAPGKNEAETGKPFCGRAGKVLDKLLSSINISREEVYITNIVKDRPPKNRDPLPEEIEIYAPFLDRQIEVIKPKVVATLGRFSMEYIMRRYGLEREVAPISVLHGQKLEACLPVGRVGKAKSFKLVPLYHPAAAIYNQHLMSTLEEDFKVLKKL